MPEIEDIKQEYDKLLNQLSDPELISDLTKFEKLLNRKNFLEKIIAKSQDIQEVRNKIEENKEILKSKEDPEFISLAETEIIQLQKRQAELKQDLEDCVSKPPDLEDKENKNNSETLKKSAEGLPTTAIIEIRAGTGGEEASLFVADLYKMYSKYASLRNWKQKVLNSRATELNGFKEIAFELSGGNVFSEIQNEGGIHRVQRIPRTEKMGRIHTSTVSVAVLLKPKKTEMKIKPEDLKIDLFRSSGPGGQNVNKRETAVRITHLPTGIVAASQNERNQLQNKENAMTILEAKILEKREAEDFTKMGEKRKAQIKWAKRAEKIRTYNFPQNRITDHRIKKSWRNLGDIMNGNLKPIVKALKSPKSILG